MNHNQTNPDPRAEYTSAPEAAAAWWAQQLGAPTYKMVGDRETGEDRFRADFASLVMLGEAAKHPMTGAQGEKFVDALVPTIEQMLGRRNHVTLAMDYGPDLELAEAAKAAGIAKSRFPWKTCMWLTRDYVTASLGYHGATKLIWTHPDWVRPPCDSQRYIDWEPRNEVCSLLRFHDGDHGGWKPDTKRCTVCGGTYVDHYGEWKKESWTHSWNPGDAS